MTVSEARAALPEASNRVAGGRGGHDYPSRAGGRRHRVWPDIVWSRSRAEVVLNEAAQMNGTGPEFVADEDPNVGGGISEQYAES